MVNMFYHDLEIPDITVLRHTYDPIANYIMDKVVKQYYKENTIDKYDALVIAYYLVKVDKYTAQEIFLGSHDGVIMDYINRISLDNSYLKPGENRTYTPIKVLKKDTVIKTISIGLATLIVSSSFVALAKSSNRKYVNELTEKYVAELINDDSKQENGTYIYDAENNAVMDGDAKVAQDIANICNQDPDLIDIALFNAYSNYEENKLYHMDAVLNYLKQMLNKDTSCYEKISTCDVFLDYLIKIRALKMDYTFYDQAEVIRVYRSLTNGGLDNQLELLSEHQQKLIDKILKSYESLEFDINNEHFKDLKAMVKNSGGRK